MNNDSPIGIFDSGIGGLTVAKSIKKLLPHENIIYYGDTAHLPYGDKSQKTIQGYCADITQFLISKKCKIIVIACNSASASAFSLVSKLSGKEIPVVNVIDPVVKELKHLKALKHIGVIGTKRTIHSKIYEKKIHKLDLNLKVSSLATPLLAPMIEEGFIQNKISQSIIQNYLNDPILKDIDSLILACTHYPLIKKEIQKALKKDVLILDSAQIVAQEVLRTLEKRNQLNQGNKAAKYQFYVSDLTDSFLETSKRFFEEEIDLKKS
jgi:glutamate racemase